MPSSLHLFTSPSAHARLMAARDLLTRFGAASFESRDRKLAQDTRVGSVIIVGATRSAADELAFTVARERGGLFGVTRMGFAELATRLAMR